MFRTEKTMFRPPGDVSQAARILGKNNVCILHLVDVAGLLLLVIDIRNEKVGLDLCRETA